MKKIIIIEFVHYQYALTLTEIFKGNEIIYIFSNKIYDALKNFEPNFNSTNVWIYDNTQMKENIDEIISRINSVNADLLCIDPIFDNFQYFAKLVKKVKVKKLFTTHNINTWFRPKIKSIGNLKEKYYKKKIINNVDYIAVEDFIYQYITEEEKRLFSKYKFVYIPYTIFYPDRVNKIVRNNNKIKIVLPGSIDYERRRYETVIETIKTVFEISNKYIFSFAGPAIGEYGTRILKELKALKKMQPENIIVFENKPKPNEFRREMESADIVLSTSTRYFKGLGTIERIGQTKPTAAIHDMITFVLPGILPKHLRIPEGMRSSSLLYDNAKELTDIILGLDKGNKLSVLKKEAEKNSKKFTAKEIIKRNSEIFKKILDFD